MEKQEPHKNHRKRMREKFLCNGISSFEDHEILEMLLFYSVPRRNTNEIGHELLSRFGSISGVFSATKQELCEVNGIGETSADFLVFLGEVYREITSEIFCEIPLDSEDSAGMYVSLLMKQSTENSSLAIYLNKDGLRITEEWLYSGKEKMTEGLCREVLDKAKDIGACGIILAHDHTNEPKEPSPDDSVITDLLKREAESVGIKTVQHIVVSDEGYIHL